MGRRLAQLLRAAVALIGIGVGVAGSALALRHLHAEALRLLSSAAARHGNGMAASDAAQRALNLRPHDYRYLEQAAYAEEALTRPQHAYALWIKALGQRPGWPYAWAQLARLQLEYRIDPQRLDYGLRQVAHLGDHERGLWKMLSVLALDHADDDIPVYARSYLQEVLRREIGYRPTNILGYALVHRRERIVCGILEKQAGPEYLCESARYMRKACETSTPLSSAQVKWCADMITFWQRFNYPPE